MSPTETMPPPNTALLSERSISVWRPSVTDLQVIETGDGGCLLLVTEDGAAVAQFRLAPAQRAGAARLIAGDGPPHRQAD